MDKRRKELALIGVGVLVVLVALYLTFRPRTQPAAAQPQTAAVQTDQPQAAPEPQTPERPQAELVESGATTTPGRDPFRPIVVAQATPASAAPATGSPTQASAAGLPPLPIPGPWGLQPTGAAPVEERLRLTGIVRGDPSVAVLRKGSKRFFVTIGDPVDNRYIVKSISEGRVVLAGGEKTLSLTLGGRM